MRITIADYDPAWPARYERERERIAATLGHTALRIEHIGSTSAPGLAAKPVVDVLVTVADPEDDPAFAPLVEAGYELRVVEPGHRMFRTPARDVHCTCGRTPIPRWADTSRSASGCARALRTAPPTSG
jgi:GrpB-like predicted nucleotidyltransferase (UPF0157 family)